MKYSDEFIYVRRCTARPTGHSRLVHVCTRKHAKQMVTLVLSLFAPTRVGDYQHHVPRAIDLFFLPNFVTSVTLFLLVTYFFGCPKLGMNQTCICARRRMCAGRENNSVRMVRIKTRWECAANAWTMRHLIYHACG